MGNETVTSEQASLIALVREHHRVETEMGTPGSARTLLGHVGDLLDILATLSAERDAAVREAAALRAGVEALAAPFGTRTDGLVLLADVRILLAEHYADPPHEDVA